MVCDSKEIKVLLMGGYGSDGVLDDCWLLDVNRGVAEKVRKKDDRETQLDSCDMYMS
jgi:hypothetical protein